MTTELVPAKLTEQALSIDRIAAENQLVFLNGQPNSGFATALRVAGAINALRTALTPNLMGGVMALQDSSLGFRTDKKDKGGYPIEAVRDCLIEAVLRGARPYGNEFNVIAGRCYLTKEFYTRVVPDLPGVSELDVRLSVPRTYDKGAIVECTASWKFKGQTQSLTPSAGKAVRELAVKVNEGMGADAILGKATRKAYKAIHDQITGWKSSDGEVDDGEIEAEFMKPANHRKRGAKASKLNEPPAEGDGGMGERP
jgi:hypothetical protein